MTPIPPPRHVLGDILLPDMSMVTLDEVARRAGLPAPPLIDPMEPELVIDWGPDK